MFLEHKIVSWDKSIEKHRGYSAKKQEKEDFTQFICEKFLFYFISV